MCSAARFMKEPKEQEELQPQLERDGQHLCHRLNTGAVRTTE